MTKQTMVELQVMFANPTLDNFVLLTEHFPRDVDPATMEWIGQDLATTTGELRQEAELQLGPLDDHQVFYRIFTRETP